MFEAYKKPSLAHKFEKSPEDEMVFRFPTSEDDRDLERFLEAEPTFLEVKLFQLSLLFESTNIKTEQDMPIMQEGDSVFDKMDVFLTMPIGMINELYDALVDYYPAWKMTAE
jgi:hypothetical protein